MAENLCLRQQILVLQRRHPRPRLLTLSFRDVEEMLAERGAVLISVSAFRPAGSGSLSAVAPANPVPSSSYARLPWVLSRDHRRYAPPTFRATA